MEQDKEREGKIKKMDSRFFKILFVSSFFTFGLFYESAACVYCGLFGLCFLVLSITRKNIKFYCNAESISVCIIVSCYLFSAFYGVDTGMGWIGFLKMLTILFFLFCTMQFADKEREEMLSAVPLTGCAMTLAGLLAYVVKPLYPVFFTAGRLGGFFQYANVFAIFCLIGLILLAKRLDTGGRKAGGWIQASLLITGILLSGSRTVFFLAALSVLFLAARYKKIKAPLIGIMCVAVTAAVFYSCATGNVQSAGRFVTASLHSSTLLGRFLYAKDGLRQVFRHPFGVGYLGYYFLEPMIQTGVYSVRYIHNDFLQMALDIGIAPMLLFACILGKNMFGKGKRIEDRFLMAVMAVHFFVDFDLEFTSMWFLLILILDPYHGKEIFLTAGKKVAFYKIAAGCAAIAGLYTGIAMLPYHFGGEETSAFLLPLYTEAQKRILARETDFKQAERLAEKIRKQNAYVPEAYDVLAAEAYQNGSYLKMSEYKKESLKLQKYNMEAYERYLVLLRFAIEEANRSGEEKLSHQLMLDVLKTDRQRELVKENTDWLAYEIRDVPEFAFSEEIQQYIVQIKTQLKKYR